MVQWKDQMQENGEIKLFIDRRNNISKGTKKYECLIFKGNLRWPEVGCVMECHSIGK